MKTTRQLVFDALMQVFRDGGYSNIVFDRMVRGGKLDKIQASFAAALFYGVLERSIGLDYTIEAYLKKGIASLDLEVLLILRMGFYQICYMDSIPPNAAVNESVNLALYARKSSAKGLINAVLRSFLREGKNLRYPDLSDKLSYMSVQYSCPRWILDRLSAQYGLEKTLQYAEASLFRPPLFVRVNTLRIKTEELAERLIQRGIEAKPHAFLKNCLLLSETGSIERLPEFREGLFHVQDASSQLCVEALSPEPGQVVADVCAAPGAKSFTAAEYMQNQGRIFSGDLYEHKQKLIMQGAARLGISIIEAEVRDASQPDNSVVLADRVLCDVPCSGWGVIRRKPEIKLKSFSEGKSLTAMQESILWNAANRVKPGGRLVYSTCTLNKDENEEVIFRFLSENNSFQPLQLDGIFSKIETSNDFMATVFPLKESGDGFFIAALLRRP